MAKKARLYKKHKFKIIPVAVALIGLGIFYVNQRLAERPLYANPPPAPSGYSWQTVWADEFDGTSIDTTKWNVINNSNYGTGGHHDECWEANNVSVSGGMLRLTAKRETVTCSGKNPDGPDNTYYFTSGMVTSRAQQGPVKFRFKQGYLEVRMKSPKGNPFWNSIWLTGPQDGSTPDWPDYGEFDITENYGAGPDATHGTFHYGCSDSDGHCQSSPNLYNIRTDSAYGGSSNFSTELSPSNFNSYEGLTSSQFNTYGFLWEPTRITWYVNGRAVRYIDATAKEQRRYEQDGSTTLEKRFCVDLGCPTIDLTTVFDYYHSIILDLAVGGTGPQGQGYTGGEISTGGYNDGNLAADLPGTAEIDYVRLYQLAANPSSNISQPTTQTTTQSTNPSPGTSGEAMPEAPVTTDPTTGAPVTVAQNNTKVSGQLVLAPEILTDPNTISQIAKVEYYVGSELKQTLMQPPFSFDTTMIPNGWYDITEKIYFKDGNVKSSTVNVMVSNQEHPNTQTHETAMKNDARKRIILVSLFIPTVALAATLAIPPARLRFIRLVTRLLYRLGR